MKFLFGAERLLGVELDGVSRENLRGIHLFIQTEFEHELAGLWHFAGNIDPVPAGVLGLKRVDAPHRNPIDADLFETMPFSLADHQPMERGTGHVVIRRVKVEDVGRLCAGRQRNLRPVKAEISRFRFGQGMFDREKIPLVQRASIVSFPGECELAGSKQSGACFRRQRGSGSDSSQNGNEGGKAKVHWMCTSKLSMLRKPRLLRRFWNPG